MEESNIKLLRSCHAWVMHAGHDLGSDLIAFRVRNFFQAATISLDTLAMALVTRAQKSKCALVIALQQ
jgi:hypothetical protein